jgi:hypothetical protein
MGTSPSGTNTFRPFYVAITSAPSSGGTISVIHTDATSATNTSITDAAFTIDRIDDASWTLASGNGLASGTFDIRASRVFTAGLVGDENDLRLTTPTAVVGTAGSNSAPVTNPIVRRTGLSLTDLSNEFHIGTISISNSPLPVELMNFTAKLNDLGQALISWQTAQEVNSYFFVVERSRDGKTFFPVDSVASSGNSHQVIQYELVDPFPFRHISYYRLRNVDLDGTSTYSHVIAFALTGSEILSFSIFPNPVTDKIGVILEDQNGGEAEWYLTDSAGRVVEKNYVTVTGDRQPILIQPEKLSPGYYFLTIAIAKKKFRAKFVVH